MPIERIIFTLGGLFRHWLLFLIPIIVALPLAALVWKLSPAKYEAKSTILMLAANRVLDSGAGGAGFPRQSALEQVAVLEAWLKSDHVLRELLPQLSDDPVPNSPEALAVQLTILRKSLTLQLVGVAVLEIRLEAEEAKGLGRKLEIIVTRLLEGVINPEAGILSATQLIIARRGEVIAEAEAALDRAISRAGLDAPETVKSRLQALYNLKRERPANATLRSGGGAATGGQVTNGADGASAASQQLDEARAVISSNPEVVSTLERLFEIYEDARYAYQEARQRAGSAPSSYVRVFDAPERLTVIGRPSDPLIGAGTGRKYAIAIMFLAVLTGLGLVILRVLLDPRLRIGEDFEAIAAVPVVARLGTVRRAD